jgi:uncharacterized protein
MMNRLHESSGLYLRQHAGNPVHWQPWGSEALERAKVENKLILVSIGYAACHWCHVMEHESFSDPEVAAMMNAHFVCIKVDREEHPDIDQQYMTAVTLMTGRGGWPLNCFALPDGRPVYGGTYFRRDDWMHVLERLSYLWRTRPEDLTGSAESVTRGVEGHERIGYDRADREFSREWIDGVITKMTGSMDREDGGTTGAPKFPMPPLLSALMALPDSQYKDAVSLAIHTLHRMRMGGIHDHLGGGFARYAVDNQWRVPHFEKMLYDNAQLLSCFSRAFTVTDDPVFRETAYGILFFLNTLMNHPGGGYYSSVDADSEGEEGRFYTWTVQEIEAVLGADAKEFARHYSCTKEGNYEHGRNILYPVILQHFDNESDKLPDNKSVNVRDNARDNTPVDESKEERLRSSRKTLFLHRAGREHPAIDTKLITSWNGLLVSALTEAAYAFDDPSLLRTAQGVMVAITQRAIGDDGRMKHLFGEADSSTEGVLEDYGAVVVALTDLYQATFESPYLELATRVMQYAIDHFSDDKSGLFFFVADHHHVPVARQMELHDHVTPSSNALMAKALKRLSFLVDQPEWHARSVRMAGNMKGHIAAVPVSYGAWVELIGEMLYSGWQVTVSGSDALSAALMVRKRYGNKVTARLLHSDDPEPGDELQFVACRDQVCHAPLQSIDDLFRLLNQGAR